VQFKDYLLLMEFGDVINQPTDNIHLDYFHGGDLHYEFLINNETYRVAFDKTSGITNHGYEITLSGPNSIDLTGLGKGTEVYKHVILALKKLVEQENPDFLKFHGVNNEQDWMYNKLYERYLKQHYTMVDDSIYLRNDVLEQIRKAGGDKWRELLNMMNNFDYKSHINRLSALKEDQRKKFLALKGTVGKIVGLDTWPGVAYINRVLQGTYEGLTTTGRGLTPTILAPGNIRKLSISELSRWQSTINNLKQNLAQNGINDVEIWK
jgi:hypothetical protein